MKFTDRLRRGGWYKGSDPLPVHLEAAGIIDEMEAALRITSARLNSANHDLFGGIWDEDDFAEELKEADDTIAKLEKLNRD